MYSKSAHVNDLGFAWTALLIAWTGLPPCSYGFSTRWLYPAGTHCTIPTLPLFLEETFLHTLVIYICFHVNELCSHSKANCPLPMTRGTFIHFPSSDGMSRSGVFITCMSEIERVKVEGGVDIFQTVKAARAQRPHMVYTSVSYY